ncbi:hypothetical protein N8D56_11310 [Devosia sp. A8/3-2]|nr:hypothetical protein N8D56_11310 [Devosia sp. A8/3-2]
MPARTDRTRTTAIVDRVITGVLGGDTSTDATANRTRQSMASFGQQQELEADHEGIKFAGKAGYDPQAAALLGRHEPLRHLLGWPERQ